MGHTLHWRMWTRRKKVKYTVMGFLSSHPDVRFPLAATRRLGGRKPGSERAVCHVSVWPVPLQVGRARPLVAGGPGFESSCNH